MIQIIKEQLCLFKLDKKSLWGLAFMSTMVFLFTKAVIVSGIGLFFLLLSQQARNKKATKASEPNCNQSAPLSSYLTYRIVIALTLGWMLILTALSGYFNPTASPITNIGVVLFMLFLVESAFISLYIPLSTILDENLQQLFAMMFFVIAVSFMLFTKDTLPSHLMDFSVLVFTFPPTITLLSINTLRKRFAPGSIAQQVEN